MDRLCSEYYEAGSEGILFAEISAFAACSTLDRAAYRPSRRAASSILLFERSEFLIDTWPKKKSVRVCVSVCVRLILVLVWKILSWF